MRRAFPIVYVRDVARSAQFYERLLGFERTFSYPPEGEPVYVSLTLGGSDLGIVSEQSPSELVGIHMGDEPRFELFVYADDVDGTVARLEAEGVPLLRPPADMPWGERIAYVADPDGNPVVLAEAVGGS